MRYFVVFLSVMLCFACKEDKRPVLGVTAFQREMNATFKDASKSPLKKNDRENFKGLDFFPVDSSFSVTAKVEPVENSEYFDMPTTAGEFKAQRVFGILHFKINEEPFQLKVYESLALKDKAGYEDYLFLPFLDLTNGVSTYGGGRYMELRSSDINEANEIRIDFNKAYNPYCAYNDTYSCPIVPRDNFINTEIRAGVKAFAKH
ncbi:DUF1684 domain-containing protein [Formosa sp. S-31]|uniref:DUF1684 domain-containing protein n=1 Tax=Formosa sp. S-31 TaxID=2790949 RepID=UPI003EB95287